MGHKKGYGCNKCNLRFDYYSPRKPNTHEEKKEAEEMGFSFFLRQPRSKDDRKNARWWYSYDCETYNPISEYFDDVPDISMLCKDCQNFVYKTFKKEVSELQEAWNRIIN